MNERYRIEPTPALTGANVRTIGTKRAMMTVAEPNRSKNDSVFATLARLNNPESLRLKIAGPAR